MSLTSTRLFPAAEAGRPCSGASVFQDSLSRRSRMRMNWNIYILHRHQERFLRTWAPTWRTCRTASRPSIWGTASMFPPTTAIGCRWGSGFRSMTGQQGAENEGCSCDATATLTHRLSPSPPELCPLGCTLQVAGHSPLAWCPLVPYLRGCLGGLCQ